MKIQIVVNSPRGVITQFVIHGEIANVTGCDNEEKNREAIAGHLFAMEYAINEYVPHIRCHINVLED